MKNPIVLLVVIALGGALYWSSRNTQTQDPGGPTTTLTDGMEPPASPPTETEAPPPREPFQQQRWQEAVGTSEEGRILGEGFRLADEADGDPEKAKAHAEWLRQLRSNPVRFQELVTWGLQKVPRSPEFAYERAGLLSFLDDEYISGELAQKLAREELLYAVAEARPLPQDARDDQELVAAMSTDGEQLRSEIAFEVWMNRTPVEARSPQEFLQIFESISRPDLKRKFARLYLERDPAREGELRTLLAQRGAKPEEWLANDRDEAQ